MPITVSITDDHAMVRTGLERMLQTDEEIRVAGIYASGKELLAGLPILLPDVLLLDTHMPDMEGPDVVVQVLKNYPQLKIIILTGAESPFYINTLMSSGVKGYLLKSTLQQELIEAVKEVADGNIYLSAAVKDILINQKFHIKSNTRETVDLSKRELEILQHIVNELTSPEIAEKIHLSLRTVENYRWGIMKKLEVKNTAGLIKKALLLGLVKL